MDLLVLADSDGVIDMTSGAIARRTNVPLDQVEVAIVELCAPDPLSRTPGEDGRRLLPLDHGRAWGWQIVNYHHYRQIRDEEARRGYFRDYRRAERAKKRDGAGKPRGRRKGKPKLTGEDAILGGVTQNPHHQLAPLGE